MRFNVRAKSARAAMYGGCSLILVFALAGTASGQGCMPLHFTTPSLGGEVVAFLHPTQWQLGISYRRVATNRFFVGDQEDEAAAPFGQPLHLRLNSVDATATYAVTYRTNLSLTVPFSYSTDSHVNPDLQRHQVSNAGIGDITGVASLWIADPVKHPRGNIQIGLGFKAPTGTYHAMGLTYFPDGTSAEAEVGPPLQLGDGGWAVLGSLQAYQQLAGRTSVYASGDYAMSTRVHTDEIWQGLEVTVPDVYSVRAGLGFALIPDQGVSISLGGRVDGTPVGDIIGGRDDYKRDAGYYAYVEPGIAWTTGLNQFTLSVPVRVRAQYYTLALSNGTYRTGAGGVNDYIMYAGWTRRF